MRAFVCAVLLLLAAHRADAHVLNMTRVDVRVDAAGNVDVAMRVDLTRPAGGGEAYYALSRVADPTTDPALRSLLGALADATELTWAGEPVTLAVVDVRLPQQSRESFLDPLSWPMTEVSLRGHLPAGAPGAASVLTGRLRASFRFEEPIALSMQRVPEGRSLTRWLIADQHSPTFDPIAVSAAATDATPWFRYVVFGFEHILPRGLDHVLFVLGLYFGARRLRTLLGLVTGFTVAHSVTLGLAAFGLVRVPAVVVEPLIALSIAWIGIENLSPRLRDGRHRLALVFAFGLLHGLGFAGALRELATPRGSYLAALVGFNVGIELGQLAVIAGAVLLTARGSAGRTIRDASRFPPRS